MKSKHSKKPEEQKRIAMEMVKDLIKNAGEVFKEDPALAHRNVKSARKIAMRFKLKLPSSVKKKFCKHCYSYLKPGINARVRLQARKVVYYCSNCRKYMRFPYNKKKAK